MDDDIDIEEHDVMDNPLIKKIFPDMSIIKKEIQGYFEEVGPLPQIKEENTDRPISVRELLTFEDEIPETENKPFESKSSSSTKNYMDETSIASKVGVEESTSAVPKYNNKIILGSKPNHDSVKHSIKQKCQQLNQICPKKAKVYNTNIVLQDVSSYLMTSNRYCKVCLILFSSKYDLAEHHKKDHSVTDITVLAKKDKLKCSFCNNLFSSYSDLFLHTNNMHDNSSRNANTSHNTSLGSDEKHENAPESSNEKPCQDTNASHSCFHCGNCFGSQQSLIDHLYNILQPNKFRCKVCEVNFSSQIKLNEHKTTHNETNVLDKTRQSDTFASEYTKGTKQMQQFYRCYICSSYYTKMKSYTIHLSRNHKEQFDLNTLIKSIFDANCKFCSTKSSNVKSYNSHVAKYHQSQLKLKKILPTLAGELTNKSDYELTNTTNISDRVTNEILESEELEKEEKYESSPKDTLVLKSTIFKCAKCDVHFLSAKDAVKHKDHIEILINWKCFTCLKIFKDKDKIFHEKQHSFCKSLTVYDLTEDTLSRVLYNCTSCTIHFTEDNFLFHYPICGLGLRTSVYCNICDILIDKNSNTCHENAHMKFHLKPADFMIVQSDVLMIGNNNNKQTNYIFQNPATNSSNVTKITNRTNGASSTHELKELNENGEYSGGVQRYINKLNESKEYERSNKTKLKMKRKKSNIDNQTRSDIDTDSESLSDRTDRVSSTYEQEELDEAGKYRGDFQRLIGTINENKEYHRPHKAKQTAKRKKSDSETVSDIDTVSGSSSKKLKTDDFKLSYCASCKCFINKNYVRDVHRESNCSRIITYVCEYCGLLLTDNSLSHHRNLHKKKKNLKLQDFKFYDLGDGKRIRPPIPSLPKCNNCYVHFVHRNSIKTHLCENVEFLTCHLCDIKLIEPAFKIHMPFHKYSIEKPIHHSALTKSQSFETQKESEKHSLEAIDVEINPAVVETNEVETSLKIVYLCECCTTALNTYDEVVEHCQKHYSHREFREPTKICTVCNLKFEATTHSQHVFNHKDCNVTFNILRFDVNKLLLDNDVWINHIFDSIPRDETEKILKKSIYKFEKRLKMQIVQEGCPNFTEYQCFKCAKFVEAFSVFNHTQKGCSRNRYPCSICGLPFATLKAKDFHEKIHTLHPNARAKSYRIVLFKWDCKTLNKFISDQSKQYVLYQCRNCNGLIDNSVFQSHICRKLSLQKCHNCGLLLSKEGYKTHIMKHKKMDSFVPHNMKVVLLGKKPNKNHDEKLKQITTSSFEGVVCDYTLYKCSQCSICVKKGEILNHICLFGCSKTKCDKCDLYFEKTRLNSHCLAHENDTEFITENMNVVLFNPKKESQMFLTSANTLEERLNSKLLAAENSKTSKNTTEKKEEMIQNEINSTSEQIAKLFKCKCGLHFLNKSNLLNHLKNCALKIRISKQNCSKCDLVFTPNELFSHLLCHHGNRQCVYKFDIEEYTQSGDTVDIIK